ncbi:MAG: efflux RND transporter periplasmic adaptor subunit [Candidatus Marinimicrobia bacterium]|nr:efflux RND transporter periplasmic adaptor subunit [Candidatus Neomarinimicrobiota bacterium]
MNKWLRIGFLLLVLSLILSGAEYYLPQTQPIDKMTVSGELASANSTVISTPRNWGMAYQIIYLAEEGTYVEQGDTIVKFDPHAVQEDIQTVQSEMQEKNFQKEITIKQNQQAIRDIERQIEQNNIQIQIYKNRLEQAQYSSENERKELELELKKAELSLDQEKQNLAAQKILNKNKLNSVLMDINQSRVRLKHHQRTLQELSILAPRGGLVVHFNRQDSDIKLKKGDNVSPGQPIVKIPDLDNMIVKIELNEVDRLKLQTGQEATIQVEAYPDTSFTGRVAYISKIVGFDYSQSYLKTYPVEININSNINYRLKPGLTAKAKINIDQFENCLSIPSWCLFKSDSTYCVKTENNHLIPIKLVKFGEGKAFIKGPLDSQMHLLPNQKISEF